MKKEYIAPVAEVEVLNITNTTNASDDGSHTFTTSGIDAN